MRIPFRDSSAEWQVLARTAAAQWAPVVVYDAHPRDYSTQDRTCNAKVHKRTQQSQELLRKPEKDRKILTTMQMP